ncbi:XshC-Cox1-family protein [Methyloprofundus sedimenti]|uniref:XshC-Cox1-family protein n=1 Tax=Methyloprofundus sedimenti TaxID=1420851 RepID=A0A1V8M4P4_9GAMM|nr:XdhC family protein [Methyloprofundus sedimenti]OQK16529.1 XshC-Cox1-family protein [Methyloprofundus sedimenti]
MKLTPNILDLQLQLQKARQPYVLATVVEIVGSSSAKPAAKALIDQDGKLLTGWVGGGCAQAMITETALACLDSNEPKVVEVDLDDEIFGAGMPCGGHMRVYVEPVIPKPQLWLMGNGRIIETLCDFAETLGFEVIIDDPQAKDENFPWASRIITDDQHYQKLLPDRGDFVVIATHHKGDYESLTQALQSEACYIALVASRKRSDLVLKRLAEAGLSEISLTRIRAPAGLALGAKLPEEIALSIASEMIMLKRGGDGRPLSNSE